MFENVYFISNDWLVKNENSRFLDMIDYKNGLIPSSSLCLCLDFWAWVTLLALANRMLANTIQKQNRIEKYMSYYLCLWLHCCENIPYQLTRYPIWSHPRSANSQLTFIHDSEPSWDQKNHWANLQPDELHKSLFQGCFWSDILVAIDSTYMIGVFLCHLENIVLLCLHTVLLFRYIIEMWFFS